MSLIRILFSAILVLIAVSSCTPVTSVNVPGKQQQKFPKKMIGKYSIHFPESLSMFEGQVNGVEFKSSAMILETADEKNESKLGDSLFYSMIGKDMYLSIGSPGNYTVLKVVLKKKEIEMYSMYCSGELTTEQLNPYFKKVSIIDEKTSEEEDKMPSYLVEIDDAKLAEYFNGSLPMKEPIILKKK